MELAPEKLGKYLIYIAVFVIIVGFLYAKTGIFTKTTEGTDEGLDQYIPDIEIGADKLKASKIVLPERDRQEIRAFKATLERVLNSGKKDCFSQFGGFSDFGEEGTSIVMNYIAREDTTNVVILYGKKDGVVTEEGFSLKGMRPCVIAGSEKVVDNFYNQIIEKKTSSNGYYNPVNGIRFKWDDGGVLGFAENRIDYGTGPNDFEGYQWLFTPDNKHICFFPTVDTWSDKDGLNDDLISKFGGLNQC